MWVPALRLPVTALVDLVLAAGSLVGAVGVGTVAHECAHGAVLRAFGVRVEVAWLPDRDGTGRVGAALSSRWATVTPRALPASLPPWGLRLAAVAPLALAAPMALVPLGVLPDPTLSGNLPLVAAAVGWLACALPSPRDFSLFWHPRRAMGEHGRPAPVGDHRP